MPTVSFARSSTRQCRTKRLQPTRATSGEPDRHDGSNKLRQPLCRNWKPSRLRCPLGTDPWCFSRPGPDFGSAKSPNSGARTSTSPKAPSRSDAALCAPTGRPSSEHRKAWQGHARFLSHLICYPCFRSTCSLFMGRRESSFRPPTVNHIWHRARSTGCFTQRDVPLADLTSAGTIFDTPALCSLRKPERPLQS